MAFGAAALHFVALCAAASFLNDGPGATCAAGQQSEEVGMRKLLHIGVVAMMSLGGCASTTDVLNATQGTAVNTALQRARFEMACPTATGSVLSRKAIDPAITMTRFGPGGPERYEYTVGIEGCGKRQTGVVICTDGSPPDCFATGGYQYQ